LCEPGGGSGQDRDGGGGFLVVVDLGVSGAGVVVEHGVDVGGAHLLVAVDVAGLVRCRGSVPVALGAADVAPAAAVGDVAQLLDIDFLIATWSRSPGWGCS
jgi:hypothetical protein